MIYFDAAATTLQKPAAVRAAVERAVNTMSSPGRGSYRATVLAEETAYRCRCAAAALFGMEDESCVVFTHNATHGLNIAIAGLVKPGGRVVITGYEHNAVLRPLYAIPDVELTVLDTPLFRPEKMLEEFRAALDAGVDVAVCSHVSNVFGAVAPMEEMAALCRRAGVPLVVDASQSAGVLDVKMDALQAAFIAMPGHKGLYGPQGTGLLLCNHETKPLLYGGTGSLSRLRQMPPTLPDRLESGTHNMPGIAGLLEGIGYVRRMGTARIARHERAVARTAAEELRKIEGVHVFYRNDEGYGTGVVSFIADGYDCQTLAEAMGRRGVAVRAGLHCAPLAHRSAGTEKTGTVRLSASAFNTNQQAVQFAQILREIVRN